MSFTAKRSPNRGGGRDLAASSASRGDPVSGRLADRITLITGASRGIGAAVALRFAQEGAHVVLAARTVGGLEEVDDAIRAAGGSATLVPVDLRDFIKIDELAAKLFDRLWPARHSRRQCRRVRHLLAARPHRPGDLGRGYGPQPHGKLALDPSDGPIAARGAGRARDLRHLGSSARRFPLLGPTPSARPGSKCWSRSMPARSPRPGCAPI